MTPQPGFASLNWPETNDALPPLHRGCGKYFIGCKIPVLEGSRPLTNNPVRYSQLNVEATETTTLLVLEANGDDPDFTALGSRRHLGVATCKRGATDCQRQ